MPSDIGYATPDASSPTRPWPFDRTVDEDVRFRVLVDGASPAATS